VALLASFLFGGRGYHRLTIDPAAANTQAIWCYTKAARRPGEVRPGVQAFRRQ